MCGYVPGAYFDPCASGPGVLCATIVHGLGEGELGGGVGGEGAGGVGVLSWDGFGVGIYAEGLVPVGCEVGHCGFGAARWSLRTG